MPSSAVLAFSDLDDLSAAPVRGGRFEITLTGRGNSRRKSFGSSCSNCSLRAFSDNLPRVVHASMPRRAAISFRTRPGPRLLMSGVEIEPTGLV